MPYHNSTYLVDEFSRECVVVGSIDTPNNWSRLPLNASDGVRLLENGAALIPRLRHAEVLMENIGLRPVRKWGVRLEYEEVTPELKARTQDNGEKNYDRLYSRLHVNRSCTTTATEAAELLSAGVALTRLQNSLSAFF